MNHTVLIVDDDFDLRETLRDVLQDEGYAVATAEDGLAALAYLEANSAPCMILLDWMMPRCNGAEFRERQCQVPAFAAIPVVLLTADARQDEKIAATGAQHYLSKPVTRDRLCSVVRSICPVP
jgi:CheY-like chemotaxis protein